jgi:hypothetical protein
MVWVEVVRLQLAPEPLLQTADAEATAEIVHARGSPYVIVNAVDFILVTVNVLERPQRLKSSAARKQSG